MQMVIDDSSNNGILNEIEVETNSYKKELNEEEITSKIEEKLERIRRTFESSLGNPKEINVDENLFDSIEIKDNENVGNEGRIDETFINEDSNKEGNKDNILIDSLIINESAKSNIEVTESENLEEIKYSDSTPKENSKLDNDLSDSNGAKGRTIETSIVILNEPVDKTNTNWKKNENVIPDTLAANLNHYENFEETQVGASFKVNSKEEVGLIDSIELNYTQDSKPSIPFFFKQVDISHEILKDEPSHKDLSLLSLEVKEKESQQASGRDEHFPLKDISGNKVKQKNLKEEYSGQAEISRSNQLQINKEYLAPVENKKKSKQPKLKEEDFGSLESLDKKPTQQQINREYFGSTESIDKKKAKFRKARGVSLTSNESQQGYASSSSNASSAFSRSSILNEPAANIRVVIRVRPLNVFEKERKDQKILDYPGEGSVLVDAGSNYTKPFTFNGVFDDRSTQEHVFEHSGVKELIEKAFDGFSCTAFAFGQTGSGKTYTITGPTDQNQSLILQNKAVNGLVPRAFQYIFRLLEDRNALKPSATYHIRASFLEVYNEKVNDLLNPSSLLDSLPVRWSKNKGFYVDNLFVLECENVEELLDVLVKGAAYRQTGLHAVNDMSSRSHSMLTVYIDCEEIDSDEEMNGFSIMKQGKISFVDLAGSEKVKETKSSGETLVESNNINKSLLTLGNCISALGDPRKKGHHVPYRESKLTKLLADSLGGDGLTLMIACISPSSIALHDTMNTLRYANRAKNIRNKPVIKMDPKEQLLQRMRRELKLLKAENNYFREQLGVPCSESQVILTPSQIKGELTPNEAGQMISPSIGANTFSTSSNVSGRDINGNEFPRVSTALYALGAKTGLYDMLQEYMNENENLKLENMELYRTRAIAQRQQEEMFHENDRLVKKLDSVGRVMLSTPLSKEHVRSWIEGTNTEYSIFSRQTIDDQLSLDSGKSNNGIMTRFPPVTKGSYPNLVSNSDVTITPELERKEDETDLDIQQSESTNAVNKDITIQENDATESLHLQDVSSSSSSPEKKISKQNKIPQEKTIRKIGNNINKDQSKSKKSSISKTWRIKKKSVAAEKPSGYAAKFAVRRSRLSKQGAQKQESKGQAESQTEDQIEQMQQLVYNQDPNQISPQSQNQMYQQQVYQQYYPVNYVAQTNPYSNNMYHSFNGLGYPYYQFNMVEDTSPSQYRDFNQYNNQLEQQLKALNGQKQHENTNKPKRGKPKR